MKRITTIPAIAVALSLGLAACGDSGTAADETEATETDAEGGDVERERPAAFFVDEAGFIDENEIGPVEERLAGLFEESGRIGMIVAIVSTDGTDIEEAAAARLEETGADALILIAGGDQQLAIVGEGLDAEGVTQAETAMVDSFDNDDIAGGFATGADFLISQLGGETTAAPEPAEAAAE